MDCLGVCDFIRGFYRHSDLSRAVVSDAERTAQADAVRSAAIATEEETSPESFMGKWSSYIAMQHDVMVQNPNLYIERRSEAARRQAGYELAAMGIGTVKVHNSELIPFPAPIRAREEFSIWARKSCTALYVSPAIIACFLACQNMWLSKTITIFQGICLLVAILSVIYQQKSSAKNVGLFYLVDELEQSLSNEKRQFRQECFEFYEELARQ